MLQSNIWPVLPGSRSSVFMPTTHTTIGSSVWFTTAYLGCTAIKIEVSRFFRVTINLHIEPVGSIMRLEKNT